MVNTDTDLTKNTNYDRLVSDIGTLLNNGRRQMAVAVNTAMVQTYWNIGKYIVEFEQKGNERAEYGSDLINRLSRDLTERYGKGFSKSNLLYIRKLYFVFQKSETLSHLLTWSHYFEILKKDDPLEINFYVKQCEIEGWSVRELKRQMQSMLFHRLALSKDKEQVLKLSQEGQQVQTNYLQRNTNSTCQAGKNCKVSWIGLSANKRKMTIFDELNEILVA